MLKRALARSGTQIIMDRDPFISVNPMGRVEMDHVKGYKEAGDVFGGKVAVLRNGDQATIVHGPKAYGPVTAICLDVGGVEAYFYWSEIYYNARAI